MTAIRVLIVDDHAILREGFKQLFALMEDFLVAGSRFLDPAIAE